MGIIKNYREEGIPQNNRLKYSDSTLGQGPIIEKKVPDDLDDSTFSKNELNSRTDDLKRISTLLTRNQGQKFLLNNAALNQLENAQTIGKNIAQGNFSLKLGEVGRGILDQAKDTANLIGSTLAQVPVNGTGTHFVHKFRTDTYLNDTDQPAGQLLGSLLGRSGYQSAPATLLGGNLPEVLEGVKTDSKLKTESSNLRNLQAQPLIGTLNTLEYPKSPNDNDDPTVTRNTTYLRNTDGNNFSMTQIGFENLTENGSLEGSTGGAPGKVESQFVSESSEPTPSGRTTVSATKSIKTGLSTLTDTSKPKRINLYRDENDDRRMSTRVRIGDPGNQSYSITGSYDSPRVDRSVDKINELSPLDGKLTGDQAEEGRDLIKFRFKIVTPDTEKWLYFRAFLDSFDDSYSGNWNSFNYVGRGEQFHTYNSFDRSISLSFKIAAQTRYEMKPIYQKMVTLASATAPTYSSEGFMRGTFAELTVGSYLYETPGIIESVQYSWQTDYPWEIAMNEPEQRTGEGGDTYQQELPMIMNATVQFKPIHRFLPETGLKHYITSPIVSSRNTLFFDDKGNLGPQEKRRIRPIDPRPITFTTDIPETPSNLRPPLPNT